MTKLAAVKVAALLIALLKNPRLLLDIDNASVVLHKYDSKYVNSTILILPIQLQLLRDVLTIRDDDDDDMMC